MDSIRKLAEVLEKNPGSTLHIDNDNWRLEAPGAAENYPDDPTGEKEAEWEKKYVILRGNEPPQCDLLIALALLANIDVQDV